MESVSERSWEVVETVARLLDSGELGVALIGGWAVYAYEPQVPSIGCDLLALDPGPDLCSLLAGEGIRVGPDAEVEVLPGSREVTIWEVGEPDLGIPEPGFEPGTLVGDHPRTVTLATPDVVYDVPVPAPAHLAVLKLAALANRSLAFRAHRDAGARAKLGPSRRAMVLSRPRSYYLRMAGKDLFDLSLLVDEGAGDPSVSALLSDLGLEEAVETSLRHLPEDVREFARDLAEEAGAGDPEAVLRRFA